MSDHEPLECPFCGGDAEALDLRAAWCVACSKSGECGAYGPMRDTEAEAVSAHNAPILERRKLKAALREYADRDNWYGSREFKLAPHDGGWDLAREALAEDQRSDDDGV